LPSSPAPGAPTVQSVLSLAQAFAGLEAFDKDIHKATFNALMQLAEPLDAARPRSVPAGQTRQASLANEPAILCESTGLAVLYKPPGWTLSVWAGGDCLEGTAMPAEDSAMEQGAKHTVGSKSESQLQEWVAKHLGPFYPISADSRAANGFVHRLDRDTSGVVVCATTFRGFYSGLLQFAVRRTQKTYIALCQGHCPAFPRQLTARLSVEQQLDGAWRSTPSANGRYALTELMAVVHLADNDGKPFSLVEIRLHTGRQHQIRAHLAAEGLPLVSDTLYGGELRMWCPRSFLHASGLRLPIGSDALDAKCPLPQDLQAALGSLAAMSPLGRVLRLTVGR